MRLVAVEDVNGNHEAFLAHIRPLFTDYAHSLNIDLDFQGFNAELASLPGAYRPPGGALLLAMVDGQPAGCGAFRALPAKEQGTTAYVDDYPRPCEMKRLFVRPAFRGLGVGRLLAEALVARARESHYATMLLDTLSEMTAARSLYAALGFVAVAPYCYNPMAGARYLKLDLGQQHPT